MATLWSRSECTGSLAATDCTGAASPNCCDIEELRCPLVTSYDPMPTQQLRHSDSAPGSVSTIFRKKSNGAGDRLEACKLAQSSKEFSNVLWP